MNVIVVVTDSMRADHVGYLGGKTKTPNIDRFAEEGTAFEQAFTESLPTLPTRTTWWTGKTNFPFRGWQQFDHWDYLLAEVLYSRGYTSALVSDTYHMHKPVYNCGRGFDNVVWVRGQEYDPWITDPKVKVDISKFYRLRGDGSDKSWKCHAEQYMRNISVRKTEEDYQVPKVMKEAMRWLEHITKKQKDNLFLWVDCFDPHEPWDPPEPFWSMYDPGYKGLNIIDPIPGPVKGYMTEEEVKHTKALYAGEVSFVDKWVGVFLDYVRKLGLFENSVIMHTTDHGEPFGEHGIIRKAAPWNYTELVHIPWVIYHPEAGKGKRVKSIVQTTDLMPTVLDSLGIPQTLELPFLAPAKTGTFPQDEVMGKKIITMDGKSLLPLMKGDAESVRDFALIGHAFQSRTIRNKEWSYHLYTDKSKPSELYDLKKDWWEQENVIGKNKELAEDLERKMEQAINSLSK
jgi:arylsulfatase A-like enzyme